MDQLDAVADGNPKPLTPERRSIPIPGVSTSPSRSDIASKSPLSSSPTSPRTTTDREREKALYPGRVNLTSEYACCCLNICLTTCFSLPGPAWHRTSPSCLGCRGPFYTWSGDMFAPSVVHQAAQCSRCSFWILLYLSCPLSRDG